MQAACKVGAPTHADTLRQSAAGERSAAGDCGILDESLYPVAGCTACRTGCTHRRPSCWQRVDEERGGLRDGRIIELSHDALRQQWVDAGRGGCDTCCVRGFGESVSLPVGV